MMLASMAKREQFRTLQRAKVRIIFVIPTHNPVKSGKLTQNQALTPKGGY